jgi:hypothetical protein
LWTDIFSSFSKFTCNWVSLHLQIGLQLSFFHLKVGLQLEK